jgi:hypothetical protein
MYGSSALCDDVDSTVLLNARPQSLPDLFTALCRILDTMYINDALGFICAAVFTNITE